ncbi:MAG TPA: fused MFS/spermidine synthase, partial [Bdellovibrionota bacterium]|nr:fused MFS/spermidine synthase [Bdellovibrionota bacterium]
YSLATTLSAYLAGLAVGAWLAPRLVASGIDGLRLYLWAELGVGIYGLAFEPLLRLAEIPYSAWVTTFQPSIPALSAAQFVIAGAVVFVPTCLMGTTLPVLCSALFKGRNEVSERLPSLYAINTLGACVGVIVGGFLLLPKLGYQHSILLAAGINLTLFVAAILLIPAASASIPFRQALSAFVSHGRGDAFSFRAFWRGWKHATAIQKAAGAALLLSGMVAMWSQILWNRLASLGFGASTYVFPIVTSAILAGIVLGSVLFRRVSGLHQWHGRVLTLLAAGGGLAFLAGTWGMGNTPWYAFHVHRIEGERSFLTYSIAELLWTWLCLVPPSAILGAIFPAALSILTRDRSDAAVAVGQGYALNIVGLLIGAVSGSFFLLPILGIDTMRVITASCLLLFSGALATLILNGLTQSLAPIVLGAIALTVTPGFDRVLITSGLFYNRFNKPTEDVLHVGGFETAWTNQRGNFRRLIDYRDDPHATVSIHETWDRSLRFFAINGKVDGNTGGDLRTTKMVVELGGLVRPDARRILTIGLGIGSTLSETLLFQRMQNSTLIELSPAMIEFAKKHFAEVNGKIWTDPRIHILNRDGREYLRNTRDTYDLIISEPSNPWVEGVASLFTTEYYREVSDRLTPDGAALLWFHTYGLDCDAVASVLHSAVEVFPTLDVFSAGGDLYMVGRKGGPDLPMHANLPDSAPVLEHLSSTLGLEAKFGTRAWYSELIDKNFLFDRSHTFEVVRAFETNTDDNQLLQFDSGRTYWKSLSCRFLTGKKQLPGPEEVVADLPKN